jgi:hypothetical protein
MPGSNRNRNAEEELTGGLHQAAEKRGELSSKIHG